MRNPLPVQELRDILGENGFLRLYGTDDAIFISDVPRRVNAEVLTHIRHMMQEQGFTVQITTGNLLLMDLSQARWEQLLSSFQNAKPIPFPDDDRLTDVYTLIRLLMRHPSALQEQPKELIRAALKRYPEKDGFPKLAPLLLEQCAIRLRHHAPLPSALADVMYTWLMEQQEEARI